MIEFPKGAAWGVDSVGPYEIVDMPWRGMVPFRRPNWPTCVPGYVSMMLRDRLSPLAREMLTTLEDSRG